MIYHDNCIGEKCWNLVITRTTDRDVQHRQRPHMEQLAPMRHDPLPQREELQLGGAYRYPRLVRLAGTSSPASLLPAYRSPQFSNWLATLFGRRRGTGEKNIKRLECTLGRSQRWGSKTFRASRWLTTCSTYWTGKDANTSPRVDYFYFSDDAMLTALRL